MREREPVAYTMKGSEARQQWSQLLNKVFRREMRVLVEKSGIPVAAIVSADDLDRLSLWEEGQRERWQVVDEIRSRNRDKSLEEVERDVAVAVGAIHQEREGEEGSQPRRAAP